MKSVLLLFFSLFLLNAFHGQSNEELKSLIATSSGLQKSQYLIQLANNLKKESPQEAFDYAIQGLELAGGNTTLEGAGNALAAQTSLYLKGYSDAISYGKKAEGLFKGNDAKNYAVIVAVLADAYMAKGDYENAIKYDQLGSEAYEELDNHKSAAFSAVGVAEVYNKQKNHKKSIEWYQKAANLFAKANDAENEVQCLISIGASYSNYGDYKSANIAFVNAMDVAKKFNLIARQEEIKQYLETVATNQEKSEQTTGFEADKQEEAAHYIETMELTQAKSLAEIEALSEEVQLAELKIKAKQDEASILALQNQQLQLEKEQALMEKDLANANADKATAEKEAEIAKSQLLYIIIGGLALIVVLIFTGFILKNQSNKKLQAKNKEILSKTREISAQRDEILKQTKNIEQSLDYATKIQQALLPTSSLFKEVVPSSFVFLKSKDHVSGDFFWFHEIENGYIAAAADCTGHGVPGAFMSIIFSNFLDKVVIDDGIKDPAKILESICSRLTEKMKERKISEQEFKDGMDVSVIHLSKYGELTYAGARNPIYIISKDQLTEIKGAKRSVGIDNRKSLSFQNHKLQLEEGDKIFLFSDGFPDQKGGAAGKKFYYQPFKELLLNISKGSMLNAESELNKAYDSWKGDLEQLDDVLVVGIEIS